MGVKIKNILGEKFGRLTVLEIISGKGQQTIYNCICDCGNEYQTKYRYLTGGTKSCGCLAREKQDEYRAFCTAQSKDKGTDHPLFQTWRGMVRRASDPKHKDYERYGAIGRDICDRWSESFWNFLEDMGDKPDESYSIERLDNSKGYSPENCVWADKTRQVFNRNYTKRPGVVSYKDGFRATLSFKGVEVLDKCTKTYEEALELREQAELDYHGGIWSGEIVDID